MYRNGLLVHDAPLDGRKHIMAPSVPPPIVTPFLRKSSLDETMRAISCGIAVAPIIPTVKDSFLEAPNESRHVSMRWRQQRNLFRGFTPQQMSNPPGMSPHHFTAAATPEHAMTVRDSSEADTDSPYTDEACGSSESSHKRKSERKWSEDDKEKHSQACKSKTRLTLEEKLEIIRLFESSDPDEHKSQKELAATYNKSRMTISTILRPDNIEWYKKLGASGVRRQAKRYKRTEHPDFERLVFEAIGSGMKSVTKTVSYSSVHTHTHAHAHTHSLALPFSCSLSLPPPHIAPSPPSPAARKHTHALALAP